MSECEDFLFTPKTRFSDSKTLALAAVACDLTEMPNHYADFIGIELAEYHVILTRYDNARPCGAENLDVFFKTVEHRTEQTFFRSLKKLDGKVDDYYMFHKNILDEVNSHNHEIGGWCTVRREFVRRAPSL